jgi:integrase
VKRNYLAAAPTVPWQKETGKRLHWLTEAAEDEVVSLMLQDGENACALTLRVLTATGMRWGEFASLEPAQIDGEWIRLWETKTDDPRSVPIDPELARALKAQNTLPNYYTFRKVLKAALKTAGQSPDICIHSLRHTTATRLVQKGVNLAIVQKFLGHKTITTTMRYVKIADDDLQIASRKITHRAGQSDKSADLVSEKAE